MKSPRLTAALIVVAVGLQACEAPLESGPRSGTWIERMAPSEVTPAPLNDEEQGFASAERRVERVLFDGRNLDEWRVGVFTGADEFDLIDGGVVLPQTTALSGMTFEGEPPVTPYSLRVDATKRFGSDFCLGVTFPVRDEHLTLVLGGWGGTVTGLSNLDGRDASDNDTMTHRHYPNGQRFVVLLHVTDAHVTALIDGETVVDVSLEGRAIGLRPEVLASRPLGLASYATCTVVHRVACVGGALTPPASGH